MKKIKIVFSLLMILIVIVGCSKSNQSSSDMPLQSPTSNATTDNSKPNNSAVNMSGKTIDIPTIDPISSIDPSEGILMDITNQDTIITSGGVYILTGVGVDSQIIIDSSDEEDVNIVLNGITLEHSMASPIEVRSAKNVIITLNEGTLNTVTDNRDPNTTYAEDATSAAIYSKDDLFINGTGTLVVEANYNDGITSKDDLTIESGTITINATDDGIVGKDSVTIYDSVLNITSGGHGIKSTNDEDKEKGLIASYGGITNITSKEDGLNSVNNIIIGAGALTITSGDDGIHSDSLLTIYDGDIKIIDSYEGLESANIEINGGNISLIASDDGINISKDDNASRDTVNALIINGGTISIDANGDGLDSNGSMYINGGYIYVSGPISNMNGPLDVDEEFMVSGGTLIAVGSSGMPVAPSDSSSQNSVLMSLSSMQSAGTTVFLLDNNGNTILSFTPEKNFQFIALSAPDIQLETPYTVSIGQLSPINFTPSTTTTWLDENGIMDTPPSSFGGRRSGGMDGGRRPADTRKP